MSKEKKDPYRYCLPGGVMHEKEVAFPLQMLIILAFIVWCIIYLFKGIGVNKYLTYVFCGILIWVGYYARPYIDMLARHAVKSIKKTIDGSRFEIN